MAEDPLISEKTLPRDLSSLLAKRENKSSCKREHCQGIPQDPILPGKIECLKMSQELLIQKTGKSR